MSEHPQQPDDRKLQISFSAAGVTIFDRPSPGILGNAIAVTLKHGRLTISSADGSAAEPLEFLRNRHIREMRVVTSEPARLRIELSDMCVDLFDEVSVAELDWVRDVIERELKKHRARKETAMAKEPVPDRWRYSVSHRPSWQDTKGLLLLIALLLCVIASLFCLRQVSTAVAAIDGVPLDSDTKLRLLEWIPATFVAICLSVQLVFSLCKRSDIGGADEGARLGRGVEGMK